MEEDVLKKVKYALELEGFKYTPLQIWKKEQVFGLVKKIDNVWEMHVRGFRDGRLESEVEICRDYLEHLNDKYRKPISAPLCKILDKYNIPYQVIGENNNQKTNSLKKPDTLTPWRPILATIFVILFLGLVIKMDSNFP